MRFNPLSKDFRGSAKRKTLVFFVFRGFPCFFFQKSKGWSLGGSGKECISEQIGSKRGNPNKAEQIGATPCFLREIGTTWRIGVLKGNFFTGIHSISWRSDWLRPETQEAPQNAKMCVEVGKQICRTSEKNKEAWKTQGRGKRPIKPLPKNSFGHFSLRGKDQSHFLSPPKPFWSARSMVRFPSPP